MTLFVLCGILGGSSVRNQEQQEQDISFVTFKGMPKDVVIDHIENAFSAKICIENIYKRGVKQYFIIAFCKSSLECYVYTMNEYDYKNIVELIDKGRPLPMRNDSEELSCNSGWDTLVPQNLTTEVSQETEKVSLIFLSLETINMFDIRAHNMYNNGTDTIHSLASK